MVLSCPLAFVCLVGWFVLTFLFGLLGNSPLFVAQRPVTRPFTLISVPAAVSPTICTGFWRAKFDQCCFANHTNQRQKKKKRATLFLSFATDFVLLCVCVCVCVCAGRTKRAATLPIFLLPQRRVQDTKTRDKQGKESAMGVSTRSSALRRSSRRAHTTARSGKAKHTTTTTIAPAPAYTSQTPTTSPQVRH